MPGKYKNIFLQLAKKTAKNDYKEYSGNNIILLLKYKRIKKIEANASGENLKLKILFEHIDLINKVSKNIAEVISALENAD